MQIKYKWLITIVLIMTIGLMEITNKSIFSTAIYGVDIPLSTHNNYFVSTAGNDMNSGNTDNPFRSIQKGIEELKSGDTLYIMAGIYSEQLEIDFGHRYSELVTIKPFEDHVVILDGNGMDYQSEMIRIIDTSFIRIEGLEIRNNRNKMYPSGILFKGSGDTIQLVNNTIHDIEATRDGHGIIAYGSNGNQAITNLFIKDNHIYDSILGSSEALVVKGNVDGFIIEGNEVHDVDNIGIDCIGFEGAAPFNDQARNGLVSNNLVYNITSANNPAYKGGLGADGIYVDGGKDIEISHNTVYNCDIGIEVASENYGKTTTGVWVHDNYVYDCGVYGIAVGGASNQNGRAINNLFEYNSLYNNDASIVIQQASDNIFQYNIIYGLGHLVEGDDRENTFVHNLWYSDYLQEDQRNPFENPGYISPLTGDLRRINGLDDYGVRDKSADTKSLSSEDYGHILQSLGIIQGDGNSLKPDATLTREELVTILYRLREPEGDVLELAKGTHFTDVDIEHWASGYIQYAYENNLTKGIGNDLFGLGEPVTYHQSVLFLQRILGYETEWENAITVGKELGIYSIDASESSELYRRHMFELICRTLVTQTSYGTALLMDDYIMNEDIQSLLESLKADQ